MSKSWILYLSSFSLIRNRSETSRSGNAEFAVSNLKLASFSCYSANPLIFVLKMSNWILNTNIEIRVDSYKIITQFVDKNNPLTI